MFEGSIPTNFWWGFRIWPSFFWNWVEKSFGPTILHHTVPMKQIPTSIERLPQWRWRTIVLSTLKQIYEVFLDLLSGSESCLCLCLGLDIPLLVMMHIIRSTSSLIKPPPICNKFIFWWSLNILDGQQNMVWPLIPIRTKWINSYKGQMCNR